MPRAARRNFEVCEYEIPAQRVAAGVGSNKDLLLPLVAVPVFYVSTVHQNLGVSAGEFSVGCLHSRTLVCRKLGTSVFWAIQ
jgi:hypothetical protein